PLTTELVHLGVDTTLFAPGQAGAARRWRERLSIAEGTRVLLSIRGWHAFYRHDMLLEAFARARRATRVPAILVFKLTNVASYPDASELARTLRARVRALGLDEHVRWLEDDLATGDMPSLYAFADAILNAPLQDTLP